MTTYTSIANNEIDAESPVTEELVTRLRDNPIAITGGATGAPRIQLGALQPITAGTSNRTVSRTGTNTDLIPQTIGSFLFLQRGTVRFYLGHRSTSGSFSSVVTVNRYRGSSGTGSTLVQSWSTASTSAVDRQVDLFIEAGDYFIIQHYITGGGGAVGSVVTYSTFATDGGDLWPAYAGSGTYWVTGNSV